MSPPREVTFSLAHSLFLSLSLFFSLSLSLSHTLSRSVSLSLSLSLSRAHTLSLSHTHQGEDEGGRVALALALHHPVDEVVSLSPLTPGETPDPLTPNPEKTSEPLNP